MSASTITSKGQTTIPADIRKGMGLQPGDQIEFHLLTDGSATMRAKRGALKDFIGVLHKEGHAPAGVREINAAIANTIRKKHRGKRK